MQVKNIEDDYIDFGNWIRILWSRKWIIIFTTTITSLIALIFSIFFITPMYKSTSTIYIMNNNNESSNSSLSYSDVQTAAMLTEDVEELVKSRTVLEKTISELEIDLSVKELSGKISVESPNESRILKITVTDSNPIMAQNIANTVRKLSAEQMKSVMGIEAVNVIDEADLPTSPSTPNKKKNILIGAFLGIILSCGAIIVVNLLNNTINSAEDVEKYLGLVVLGAIPHDEKLDGHRKKTNRFR